MVVPFYGSMKSIGCYATTNENSSRLKRISHPYKYGLCHTRSAILEPCTVANMPIGKIGDTAGKGADYKAGSVNLDAATANSKLFNCL